MLRISTINDDQATHFKLEGKLAHEWVAEAAKAWTALLDELTQRKSIVVDLCGVSFVDDGGRALLTQMHSAGAKLVGAGPFIGSLIEEINDCGVDNGSPSNKNKWMRGIVGALFFFLLANLLLGQEPPKQAEMLTLDRAIALAVANNRQVRIANLELRKSTLDWEISKTRRLPSFSTNLYGSGLLAPVSFVIDEGTFGNFPSTGPIPDKRTKITTDPTFNLFVTGDIKQPISQLHRINLGIQASKLSIELSREEIRAQRIDIANQVRATYYEILRLQSATEASRTAIDSYRELSRLLDSYAAEQTVLKSDVLDVKTSLLSERQRELGLRHALQAQKEQLNLLLAREPETDFTIEPIQAIELSEMDLVAARSRALDQRPELKQASISVRQADLNRRSKKSEYIPDVSAFVSYISPFNINFVPKNIATAGLQLSWEPFDWGRKRRELQERQLIVEQNQQKLEETRSRIVIEVGIKFRKLEDTKLQLEAAKVGQEAAQEKVRVTTAKFTEYAALLRDVLEQQARLASVNHQYQEALLSFWNAKADFAKSLGEE